MHVRARAFVSTVSAPANFYTLSLHDALPISELQRIAALLREAAGLATEPTLKAFLTKRADALLSNDYYDSDVAWMEIDRKSTRLNSSHLGISYAVICLKQKQTR